MKDDAQRSKLEEFFHLIRDNKTGEAERVLEEIRSTLSGGGDWSKGYIKALEGLILARRNDEDSYLYANRILRGEFSLQKAIKEFEVHSLDKLHGDYDRGYFKALADLFKHFKKAR